MRFAAPAAFILLLLVPLMLWRLLGSRGRMTPKLRFSSLSLLGRPRATLRSRLRWLPRTLALAAAVLAIVALARPQTPWSEQKRKAEGVSIMLVLDVSETMRARDFKPDRLRKAKELTQEFIRGRTEDLIGLVIFGKETFALCPLTHDYDALLNFVGRIDFDLVDGNGTAIGMGLANAVNKLKDAPTKSKVAILLTDGENNWGEIQPQTAGEIARDLKIRVYTIGVGSKGLVDMPKIDQWGREHVGSVISSMNTEELEQIAAMTGGKFFEATDGEKLRAIYEQIDKMERTKVETNQTHFYDEMGHLLLLPALALLALAMLLDRTWLWSFP